MGVNKVVFGAVAIMDISDSTVTPETLSKGVTAYDKTGEKITGTHECEIVSGNICYVSASAPTSSVGNNGDIYIHKGGAT